ncbi:MAG: hypothetical protein NTY19_14690 [Planctomycetota bacterium]|nr:hypothetical protein [Planctomycetota bacterium]
MSKRKALPKLGKWWAFLKRRLLLLPQEPFTVEVDFCPLPDIAGGECGFWLGLVVHHQDGSILLQTIDEQPPDLERIAHVLAGTMQCVYPRPCSRPEAVLFRDDPEWQAMVPYLKELGIETVVTEELPQWDAKAEAMIRWLQEHWSTFPKARIHPDKLPIPKVLYDLRYMAYWFGPFQRAIPGEQEAPP